MSILIKGMKMPTSCARCPMLEGDRLDGLCHAASRWLDDDEYWTWYVYPEGDIDDSKPCNCPLIELSPHGRLIDAEELKEWINSWFDMDKYYHPYSKGKSIPTAELLDIIENIPTILEAEVEE